MKEVKLGNKVKDTVTDFTGIATSRIEFLNGCTQLTITAKADDKGVVQEMQVDDQQVKYVSNGILPKPKPVKKAKPGGPSHCSVATHVL